MSPGDQVHRTGAVFELLTERAHKVGQMVKNMHRDP